MAAQKLYEWEAKAYPKFRDIRMGKEDAEMYYKKFARHFKVSEPLVGKPLRRVGGVYWGRTNTIQLEKLPTFGTVIHEFAHHLASKEYGGRQFHNKNFKRSLKRVYTFAKRYIK
jgi:hypothetical protein